MYFSFLRNLLRSEEASKNLIVYLAITLFIVMTLGMLMRSSSDIVDPNILLNCHLSFSIECIEAILDGLE